MYRFLRSAAFLLLATLAGQAASATLESVAPSDDPAEFARLRLTGPIAAGDAQALRAVFAEKVRGYYFDTHFVTITLDSPGGSFAEAIRLMDLFDELKIATRVEDGASCLSACAVAFMGGTRVVANLSRPGRTVEPGGKLGFHAPSLSLPGDALVPVQALEASYDLALDSISGILARRDRFDIPVSLVETMIATPPAGMYLLETVDDFARWNIAVEMDPSGWRPDSSDVARMCLNHPVWQRGASVAAVEAAHRAQDSGFTRAKQVADWAARVRFLEPSGKTGVRSVLAYASETGMEVTTCVVRFTVFREQWHPRIFLSDAPPEIALEAARQSNASGPAPSMLHALPHDVRVESLR